MKVFKFMGREQHSDHRIRLWHFPNRHKHPYFIEEMSFSGISPVKTQQD